MGRRVIVAVVLALGFATGAAWAQDEGPKPPPPPTSQPREGQPGPRDGWQKRNPTETMDKVVTLTDDQKKKLEEMATARQKAMKDWNETNGEKVKTAYEALQKAYDSKDKDAIEKAAKELRDVTAGQMEIWRKYDPATVLTPEQKVKWHSFRLMQLVEWKYRPANLTDEQKTKAKEAADALAKDGKLDDPKAFEEAMKSLDDKVQESLTADQKEAMKKAATSRPRPRGPGMRGPGGPGEGGNPPPPPPAPNPDKAPGGAN
jgi:Spy/CpxP family protein refolding chaperone